MHQRIGIVLSTATLVMVAFAGCTLEGMGVETGTLVFCVQDDPTVNFRGVFVNFGNIQINTATSGNNTINDNDTFGQGGNATTTADTTEADATDPANGTTPANETTETSAATATTNEPQTTLTTGPTSTGGSAEQIQAGDVECSRLAGKADFDYNVPGQRNLEDTGDGENPGRADEARGESDAPCDADQGFGNDWKCEGGRASRDLEPEQQEVDVLQFREGRAAFLARAQLPPITIDNACVTLDKVRIVDPDGVEREAELEADQVCVEGPIEIREDHETLAVLKVDLERSIRDEGDRIVFSPVLHLRAAAPVTQTITIGETATQTVTQATGTGNETMTGAPTNETTEATAATETTAQTTSATNETAPPSPTNETVSPTNTTSSPGP